MVASPLIDGDTVYAFGYGYQTSQPFSRLLERSDKNKDGILTPDEYGAVNVLRSAGLYAPATSNLRLAAVRRVAYEAADSGLLSPELGAGIREDEWLDWNPVWSPDDEYIYFSSGWSGVMTLWSPPQLRLPSAGRSA